MNTEKSLPVSVCAWCHHEYNVDGPTRKLEDAEYLKVQSHGVCPTCRDLSFKSEGEDLLLLGSTVRLKHCVYTEDERPESHVHFMLRFDGAIAKISSIDHVCGMTDARYTTYTITMMINNRLFNLRGMVREELVAVNE